MQHFSFPQPDQSPPRIELEIDQETLFQAEALANLDRLERFLHHRFANDPRITIHCERLGTSTTLKIHDRSSDYDVLEIELKENHIVVRSPFAKLDPRVLSHEAIYVTRAFWRDELGAGNLFVPNHSRSRDVSLDTLKNVLLKCRLRYFHRTVPDRIKLPRQVLSELEYCVMQVGGKEVVRFLTNINQAWCLRFIPTDFLITRVPSLTAACISESALPSIADRVFRKIKVAMKSGSIEDTTNFIKALTDLYCEDTSDPARLEELLELSNSQDLISRLLFASSPTSRRLESVSKLFASKEPALRIEAALQQASILGFSQGYLIGYAFSLECFSTEHSHLDNLLEKLDKATVSSDFFIGLLEGARFSFGIHNSENISLWFADFCLQHGVPAQTLLRHGPYIPLEKFPFTVDLIGYLLTKGSDGHVSLRSMLSVQEGRSAFIMQIISENKTDHLDWVRTDSDLLISLMSELVATGSGGRNHGSYLKFVDEIASLLGPDSVAVLAATLPKDIELDEIADTARLIGELLIRGDKSHQEKWRDKLDHKTKVRLSAFLFTIVKKSCHLPNESPYRAGAVYHASLALSALAGSHWPICKAIPTKLPFWANSYIIDCLREITSHPPTQEAMLDDFLSENGVISTVPIHDHFLLSFGSIAASMLEYSSANRKMEDTARLITLVLKEHGYALKPDRSKESSVPHVVKVALAKALVAIDPYLQGEPQSLDQMLKYATELCCRAIRDEHDEGLIDIRIHTDTLISPLAKDALTGNGLADVVKHIRLIPSDLSGR